MWRACCLRVGEGSVECERGFSFSLPTVPTTLVIIFFRRKSVTYIIYVYTLILMKKGASSGAFTVSSLPTMSTTSSALSFSSSIIVVSPGLSLIGGQFSMRYPLVDSEANTADVTVQFVRVSNT